MEEGVESKFEKGLDEEERGHEEGGEIEEGGIKDER